MNTTSNQRTTRAILAAAAALGLGACATSAQSSGGGSGSNEFSRPLGGAPQGVTVMQPGAQTSVRVMMSQSSGDDNYEVSIDGDKITAKVNGKEVPKDRVRKNGDTIEILGKNGEVVSTFHTASRYDAWSTSPNTYYSGMGGNFTPWTATVNQDPPPVMLGVTMVEPGEMMTEQLELEPGTGVLLDRVIDGLAADKAGLKKGDVIVSFDGIKPATVVKVREALAKKHPGDKVKLVFLRKGDEKAATLELQKYDPERLDATGAYRTAVTKMRDDVVKTEKAQKAMEEALKQHALTFSNGGGQGWVFTPGNGDPFEVYTSRLGQATPEMKERMAELNKKLSELDEKIGKLDEALDRLEKKLDKLGDRK